MVATALADGFAVRTYSRSAAGIPAGVANAERFLGTLPDALPADLFDGVDAVVHCAAWVGGPAAEAAPVNVDATLGLAEAAAAAGVRTFVFLSTQSAHVDARSDYGRTKYAAEQALRARFRDASLAVVILRLGLVTGAGTRGFYRRLATFAERWPLVPIVGAEAPAQPIHVDDVCRAALAAVRRGDALRGRVLCLGAPDVVTLRVFLSALAVARSGRAKPVLAVPLAPLARLARFAERSGLGRIAERAGLAIPVTSQNLEGAARVVPMDTRADLALLGVPERTLAENLRDDLGVDSAIRREADRLGRYLVGRAPSPLLAARYAQAIDRLGLAIAPDEARVWRLAMRMPRLWRVIDGGLALAKPHGTIRRRLHALLAILEASPDHCDAFLPVASGLGERVAIAAIALRAGLAGALGVGLVLALGVRPR